MPTADRTTVRAALDELLNKLRVNVVADPPTATKPFRRVEVGECKGEEFSRPFLSLYLTRVRPVGAVDNDRIMEATMKLAMFTDVTDSDPHPSMLDKIGAVEDYLDGIVDTGVIDGAEGFDDRVWEFEYPLTTSGARLASASATQTFVVKVSRGQNRVET